MSPIQWLILFIVLIAIEAVTLGLTTIWLAGGALAALIASALGAALAVQLAVFVLVSVVLVVFTRPIAARHLNHSREKTNVEGIIGRHGVVTESIDNLKGQGRVMVSGQEWSARSSEENVAIAQNAAVEVLEVQGVKLICREI